MRCEKDLNKEIKGPTKLTDRLITKNYLTSSVKLVKNPFRNKVTA